MLVKRSDLDLTRIVMPRTTMPFDELRSYYVERGKTVKMLRTTSHTARKVHECDCGEPIQIGERYTKEVFLLDGELTTSVTGHGHEHTWTYENRG